MVKIQNQKSTKLGLKHHLLQDTFTNLHETNNQLLFSNLFTSVNCLQQLLQ